MIVAWLKYEPIVELPPRCSWEDEGDDLPELPEWKPLSPLNSSKSVGGGEKWMSSCHSVLQSCPYQQGICGEEEGEVSSMSKLDKQYFRLFYSYFHLSILE